MRPSVADEAKTLLGDGAWSPAGPSSDGQRDRQSAVSQGRLPLDGGVDVIEGVDAQRVQDTAFSVPVATPRVGRSPVMK